MSGDPPPGSAGADEAPRTGDVVETPPSRPDVVEGPVSIIVVTPQMATGTAAEARHSALAEASRGDRSQLAALAAQQPWLLPTEPFACGCHLRTDGLVQLAGAPEFEMVNVPAAFVPAASQLLNQLAHFVLTRGTVVRDGQVLSLDPHGSMAMAKDVTAAADGEADRPIPTLRLILLA